MTEEQEAEKEEGSKRWIVKSHVLHDDLEDVLNELDGTYRIDQMFTGMAYPTGSPTTTVVGKRRKTEEEILR